MGFHKEKAPGGQHPEQQQENITSTPKMSINISPASLHVFLNNKNWF